MPRQDQRNRFVKELEELIDNKLKEPVYEPELEQIISGAASVIEKRLLKVESFDALQRETILNAIGNLMTNNGIDFRQGLRVFDEIEKRIIDSHEIRKSNKKNGELSLSAGGEQAERVPCRLPSHVQEFDEELDNFRWIWLQQRIVDDLPFDDLTDKKAALERHISVELAFGEYADQRVLVVATNLLQLVMREIGIQMAHLETSKRLGLLVDSAEGMKDEQNPANSGQTEEPTSYLSDGICPKCGKGEKYADRNIEVVTLILDDILGHIGIRPRKRVLAVKDYAEVIGFITGYSANTTKGILNNPQAKYETAHNAYDKDNEVRRTIFKKMNLHELARKVQ